MTGLTLPGATTIEDKAGNDANLTGAVTSPAGRLQIDTTAPTVTKVVTSPRSGDLTTGHTARITLDMSEKVTVVGSPVLLLNDGGTAIYDPVRSTAMDLVFNYTPAAGQVTTDLLTTGLLFDSSSAVTDLAGNAANFAAGGANLGLEVNIKNTGPAGPSGGTYIIDDAQELELFGPSSAAVTFAPGGTGTLKLDASQDFGGTVAGLAPGNHLDLSDLVFEQGVTPTYTANAGNTGGTLSLSDGRHAASIVLFGQYQPSSFAAMSDGHGGTLVFDPAPNQQPTSSFHA